MDKLAEEVKKGLNTNSAEELKSHLISKGYLEDDIQKELEKAAPSFYAEKQKRNKKFVKLLTSKEILDRLGYGFGSQQFVNILFYLTGASFFLIGIITGLKVILTSLLSSFIKEFSKLYGMSRTFIRVAGVLFGLSFLFIALAKTINSTLLFTIALLAGTIGVVTHGDLYNVLVDKLIKKEKMTLFLARISYYGIPIIGVAFLLSGYLLDKLPLTGYNVSFSIFNNFYSFKIYGFLISFEITAFMFIFSGYILSFFEDNVETAKCNIRKFIKSYCQTAKDNFSVFRNHRLITMLAICMLLSVFVQTLGSSYYGIFIYKNFKNIGFGPFMNVAVIFLVAIIVSLIGPVLTRKISIYIGEAPMLVFGTLLIALLPLAFAFNPNLLSIGLANAISIIGSSIVGVAQGFLARRILSKTEMSAYLASLGLLVTIPFIILIPIGSYIAQTIGLQILFAVLGFILALIVAPLYFVMVVIANKKTTA